ncbi:hypothetical protein ACG3SL_07290 [Sphingomonas sp. CJ20]
MSVHPVFQKLLEEPDAQDVRRDVGLLVALGFSGVFWGLVAAAFVLL